MNWLIWRQHRKGFLALGIFLVILAAVGIPMGQHFWHSYQHALTTCTQAKTCDQLSDGLLRSGWDSNLNPALPTGGFNFMTLFIWGMPFVLGIFLGVPLVAREYVNKTNLFIWTRSVSRRKWLTSKLVWLLLATAVFAAGFATLITWWSKTGNTLYLNRFETLNFAMQGIVPIGQAVFAVALGIMFGALFKRILLGVALTFSVFLGLQIVIANMVRSHYMTPRTYTVSTNQFGGSAPKPDGATGAWITSSKVVNNEGQVLDWLNPPSKCIVPADEVPSPQKSGAHTAVRIPSEQEGSIGSYNGGPTVRGSCLQSLGYHYVVQYQPAYRYWSFQWIEVGLYVLLSLMSIGITYWLVLKRDA